MQAASSILTWHHSLLSHGILEILHSHREAQASSNILYIVDIILVHWFVLFYFNTKLIPFLVSVWSRLLKSTKIFYILQYSGEPFRSAKPCLGYRPDHSLLPATHSQNFLCFYDQSLNSKSNLIPIGPNLIAMNLSRELMKTADQVPAISCPQMKQSKCLTANNNISSLRRNAMSGCGWNIMDIYHLYHHHNEEEIYTALLWMETID